MAKLSERTTAGIEYQSHLFDDKLTRSCRDRFKVCSGDAKTLLPKIVDEPNSIDLFYHDSDHTYDHTMFEFKKAKRKLRPAG